MTFKINTQSLNNAWFFYEVTLESSNPHRQRTSPLLFTKNNFLMLFWRESADDFKPLSTKKYLI